MTDQRRSPSSCRRYVTSRPGRRGFGPVLVVRCLSRATNTFVVLGTSAKFEDDDFRRTIRVQWDDGPETVQQWEVSNSAHELFAPDGVAFVRQLAKANRLRFGFTPFNAPPVTAEFAVQGFDQLASAGRQHLRLALVSRRPLLSRPAEASACCRRRRSRRPFHGPAPSRDRVQPWIRRCRSGSRWCRVSSHRSSALSPCRRAPSSP